MRFIGKLISVLSFMIIIALGGCAAANIETAFHKAGIEYARIIGVKTIDNEAIVFYETLGSTALGIGRLDKSILGWRWKTGGGYLHLSRYPEISPPHFYRLSNDKLGRNDFSVVYGIFHNEETQDIEATIHNKEDGTIGVMRRNVETFKTVRGETLWYIFLDSPTKPLVFLPTSTIEQEGNRMLVKIFTKPYKP